jgi:UDP-N-acetylglucosamine 2-epimerase (non-hydrolysing)
LKVMTVLGTRPEIIRLSLIIGLLDRHADHLLVHTGQNYDDRLNGLFFRELGVRDPDFLLGVKAGSFGEQIGQILCGMEPLLREHRPERLLILGDTNSGLSAIIARRLGIPVYHMEAGNRCYDFRVPEEGNRRIIDHMSTVLLPYTCLSRENLLREGFAAQQVYVTGNPIKEVIDHYAEKIAASKALADLDLTAKKYFLITMHRAENVDDEGRLRSLMEGLSRIHAEFGYPIICSTHPRTRAKAQAFGIRLDSSRIRFVEPFGFFDFVKLERSCFCVLSDSGTVQEEACIFGVPNVTIRDVTERPETIACGSNVLAGADPQTMLKLVKLVTARPTDWQPPPEYLMANVADTVTRILLGHASNASAENPGATNYAQPTAATSTLSGD